MTEETYVNIETGETITENLAQSPTLKKHEEALEEPEIYIETKEDDGWFSGLFPSLKNANNDLKSLAKLPKQKDTTVVKEKPILVESLPIKSKKVIILLISLLSLTLSRLQLSIIMPTFCWFKPLKSFNFSNIIFLNVISLSK